MRCLKTVKLGESVLPKACTHDNLEAIEIVDFGLDIDPFIDIDSIDCLFPSLFDEDDNVRKIKENVASDNKIIKVDLDCFSDETTKHVSSQALNLVSDGSVCTNTSCADDEECDKVQKNNQEQNSLKKELSFINQSQIKRRECIGDSENVNERRKRRRKKSYPQNCQEPSRNCVSKCKVDDVVDEVSAVPKSDQISASDNSLNIQTSYPFCTESVLNTTSESNIIQAQQVSSQQVSSTAGVGSAFSTPSSYSANMFFHNQIRNSGMSMVQYATKLSSARLFIKDQQFKTQYSCNMEINSTTSQNTDTDFSTQSNRTSIQNLKDFMTESGRSQFRLEEHDRANGLPKSHSQTMVKSAQSRRQLQNGRILCKWDGTPLISYEEGKGWVTNLKRRRRVSLENETTSVKTY